MCRAQKLYHATKQRNHRMDRAVFVGRADSTSRPSRRVLKWRLQRRTEKAVDTFYEPLSWLRSKSETVNNVFDCYLKLCE
jgi:hypothetical protein